MNRSSEQLRFLELTSLQDDLLLPWLDLYETAFPAAERVLVSKHLLALKGVPDVPGEHHMLAALDGNASFAGLARYQVLPDLGAAYLWYLATAPELRNQGVGTKFYQEIVRRVTGPAGWAGLRALVIEVEIPARAGEGEGVAGAAENSAVAAERALAQRRIAFYRRQGARLMEGIHYLQSVGRHQAPIPMHIMFHAFGALDAAQAFALARSLWGDQVSQVGKLRLT
jgi:GNAT superfamily N-acetyltransferase